MLHAMWPREVASVTLGDVWLTGTQCNFFCLNRTRRLSTWILAILGLRSNCIMGLFWQTNFDPLFCATSWKPIQNFKPSHSAIRHNTDPVSGGISKWQSLFCSSFLKPFFILFRVCFFFWFLFLFHFPLYSCEKQPCEIDQGIVDTLSTKRCWEFGDWEQAQLVIVMNANRTTLSYFF